MPLPLPLLPPAPPHSPLAAGPRAVVERMMARLTGRAATTPPAPDAALDLDLLCRVARIGVWRESVRGARRLSPVARSLLGLAAGAPEAADPLAHLPPEDRVALERLLHEVQVSGQMATQEVRLQHPRGGLRHLRWQLAPLSDAQGRPDGVVAVVQDITEWRQAEERRRQASRMHALGQLAAGLAHDFNNLLCAITLNLDLLEQTAPRPSARAQELIARARQAATRGGDLTAQLLAFAGKHPAQRQPVDLAATLRDCLAKSLDLPLTTTAEALVVEADPLLLRAALQALLDHARDAAPERPVRVELDPVRLTPSMAVALGLPHGAYARVSVFAAGQKVAPELLDRLFEPFFRPAADGLDPNGAGVGLAMVHGFARAHGGTARLEPVAEGGTAARLLLPLAPDSVARLLPPAAAAAEPAASGRLAGLRVLLVEDDREVREVTELLLADEGASVTAVADAPEALALLQGPAPFELLLSDVVLPGPLSGLDVVEAAGRLRPELPALLASGYAAPAQELGRALPGGVILLGKPYRRAELFEVIAATLRRARARDAA